ncbi:MAG: DUF4011 domain-containing protein, partial [Pirellulaceae bacterium]|nr:DUF4011 domain-containing protein [Pirellulaceae bacterium]
MTSFREYHLTRTNAIGYTTEDVLVSFLPLARQVSETHQRGSVAPLQGVSELRVREGAIWFEDGKSRPVQSNLTDVAPLLEEMRRGAAEVVAEHRREFEIGDRAESITDLQVAAETGPIDGPVYLPNYESWEHAFDHHDPLTDIYSLGMILASMACGLDFHDPSDLETFVRNRRNLFQVRRDLHPVIARAVLQMTDLDRAARPADLQALLQSLHNFGEQPVELQFELDRIEGFHTKDLQTKQQLVLAKLQERLFEISRRNRLLHFRSTMQTLNLTEASVPLSFDYKNVREDQLLTWNAKFSKACVAGQSISLHKYLNFQEALYLPMVLDRIRTEARRDQAEFGFAQLRLVICFLRWSNLKEEPPELFHSPLVLLPVELTKKKGVRDSYLLRVLDTQAEVNPVLRHQFKQLYNVELPETIDLEESNLQTFYEYLQAQIGASESAVELTLVEKPRISLLHDKARRRLDQYRRRARLSGRGVRNYLELDYSYDPANYHPMGLTLFSTKIRQPETQLRAILEKRPRPKSYMSNPADGPADAVESEKTFFTLKRAADDNPYNWEFDLCSVTLGNFKYRKMSLVRDYAAMVDREIENQAFDDIFSLTPRPVADADQSLPDLVDRFHVVPCDPTQTASIAGASNGESYIIQGPPGTGKSQTITNLIADYVARGKRVLFVCEKRAAIDVVYLRLKQQGLHELCCLIHDSQADKKQFVMDLKETYESFLSGDWGNGDGQSELTSRLDAELEPLVDYRSAMLESSDPDGPALRDVVDRAVELAPRRPDATALEIERAPRYECWRIHAGELARFRAALEDIQADGVLANHPLALLSPKICDAERPLELITTSLASARSALDDLEEEFGRCHVIRETWSTVKRAEQLVEFARVLAPLARCRGLTLLDGNSALSAKYGVARNQLDELRTAWVRAGEKNAHWREKLPKLETPIALRQARRLDGKWWAALSPTWWRLRSVMNRCYNYAEHAIRPSWVDVLQNLQAEQDAEQRWADDAAKMQSSFGFEQDVDDFAEEVARAIQQVESCEGPLGALRQEVSRGNVDPAVVLSLVGHAATVERLNSILAAFLDDYQERTWDQLRADFSRVERALEQLDNFLFCLTELSPLPREMASAIRQLPYDLEELESLSADQFIADAARRDRRVGRFNGLERDRRASRLEQFYDDWLGGNAVEVRARVRAAFRERVRVCGLPAAQLSDDQKEFKKFYNRGRRELEHEFSKTMRYKSIRGLVSGDSGEVVKDLKPVWLMSPLSVSDTVPLAGSHFDVVIFDEASQITLEEAVPTIFRAPQA